MTAPRGLVAVCLCVLACAGPRHGAAPPLPTPQEQPDFPLGPAHEEPELVSVTHTVHAGQTLYRIAKLYGVSVGALVAANGLEPGQAIRVGQELLIPGAGGPASVATAPDAGTAGPRVSDLIVQNGVSAPELLARAGEASAPTTDTGPAPERAAGGSHGPTNLRPTSPAPPPTARPGPLSWPLRGVLYARFGKKGKEPHDGIDLAAPVGTPVKTAAPGKVLFAGEQQGYGNIVIVEHKEGLVTIYAHNRDVRVKTGQQVREAQVLATVGESGRTSGPHLHFEVRKDGTPVDPLRWLSAPAAAL